MAKGKTKGKKGSRRAGGGGSNSSSDDEHNPSIDDGTPVPAETKPTKKLDFAERREMQRAAAAEKRKAKMRCHLCGKAGHVRRECPGIDDDGRGESKYTNSKGDKGSRSSVRKGTKNRGRKNSKSEESVVRLELPDGFAPPPVRAEVDQEEEEVGGEKDDTFLYFDASCDSTATIEYLRSGRGKSKISMKDAISEYDCAIVDALTNSNYGGCIARSFVKPGRPWSAETAYPLESGNVWFAIGLADDVDCLDAIDSNASYLVETVSSSDRIVGVFFDADYTADRDCQTRRLLCTLQAASQAGVPIQIRMPPSPAADSAASEDDLWLADILKSAIESHPPLKVHLSCWSGGADHMNALLQSFPENVWFGFDGTVSFGKASHLHECAFDLPLSKLLLETGTPGTIPSKISKAVGREAFVHSGHIPHVAEAFAERKTSAAIVLTAEDVAQAASANTLFLYPALADVKA